MISGQDIAFFTLAMITNTVVMIECIVIFAMLCRLRIQAKLDQIIYFITLALIFITVFMSVFLDLCISPIKTCIQNKCQLPPNIDFCPAKKQCSGEPITIDYFIYQMVLILFMDFIIILRQQQYKLLIKKQQTILIFLVTMHALVSIVFLYLSEQITLFDDTPNSCKKLLPFQVIWFALTLPPAIYLFSLEAVIFLKQRKQLLYYIDDQEQQQEEEDHIMNIEATDYKLYQLMKQNQFKGYDCVNKSLVFQHEYIMQHYKKQIEKNKEDKPLLVDYGEDSQVTDSSSARRKVKNLSSTKAQLKLIIPWLNSFLQLAIRIMMVIKFYERFNFEIDKQQNHSKKEIGIYILNYIYNIVALIMLTVYPLVVSITPLQQKPTQFNQLLNNQQFISYIQTNNSILYWILYKQLILYKFYLQIKMNPNVKKTVQEILKIIKDLHYGEFKEKYEQELNQCGNQYSQRLFDEIEVIVQNELSRIYDDFTTKENDYYKLFLQFNDQANQLNIFQSKQLTLFQLLKQQKSYIKQREKNLVKLNFLIE